MLKFVSSLLFSSLLLILGCSNPALLVDNSQKNSTIALQQRTIPKRSDVVKNENNVITDRSIKISGKDLYINSKFMRSIVPSNRFASITRGRDISDDLEFPNDKLIDSIAEKIWTSSSEEEKNYFLDNIDELIIDMDVVIEAEASDDATKELTDRMKQINEAQDELFNGLGLDEAAITVEETRSLNELESFNPTKYRAVNKFNRYRNTQEVIVKAADLACYFLMNGDIEEVENIADMFDADIDIEKIKKIQIGKAETRGTVGVAESEFDPQLKGTLEWIKDNGKSGDIVSRCLWDTSPYGAYDHSGLLNKERFLFDPKDSGNSNTKWAKCILASYPNELKAPSYDKRKPERLEYAAYEPLANFTDSKHMAVNKPKLSSYGSVILKTATNHFYGDNGTKNNYDKWCAGIYDHAKLGFKYKLYNCVFETLKTSNASDIATEQVNYCSYIPWYGYYRGLGIDIDSDTYRNSTGNMKVPQDIVNSGNPKTIMVWVTVNQAAGCGLFGGGSGGYYVEELDYSSCKTKLYSWHQ